MNDCQTTAAKVLKGDRNQQLFSKALKAKYTQLQKVKHRLKVFLYKAKRGFLERKKKKEAMSPLFYC